MSNRITHKRQGTWGKKFRGPDRFGRMNDQLVVAAELGADAAQAEIKASEISGQPLKAKDPNQIQTHNPGDTVLPYANVKGLKVREVRLDELIWMLVRTKWITHVNKDKYRDAIYHYLLGERLSDTVTFFKNMFKGVSNEKLIEWYNTNFQSKGNLTFHEIVFPIIKDELRKRNIDFEEDNFN